MPQAKLKSARSRTEVVYFIFFLFQCFKPEEKTRSNERASAHKSLQAREKTRLFRKSLVAFGLHLIG